MLLSLTVSHAQETEWPQTRAEQTAYRETSRYDDVMAFLERLQAKGAPIAVETIGTSESGKKIPLVIISRPPITSPQEARRQSRVVVYLQANIHGGEVEGKEAVLMLMRQIAQEDKARLLDKLVLLVTPVYNIDGNDNFGDAKRNRGSQDGPDPVGQRANGQGFDLNRDAVKAESQEMRAALRHIYTTWDPDVMMDLHTTNGTRHGYHLTYAPPLHPDTEAGVLKYSRDELLPALRRRLRQSRKWELFDYGNVEGREPNRAWRSVGPEPRYVTNYAGLRNRIAVLSEAASFLPFKTRVEATYDFVVGVLEESAKNAAPILKRTRDADARVVGWGLKPETAPMLGVRFEMISRGIESIPLEKPRPAAEIDHRKAPTDMETLSLPVFDRFRATRTAKFPAGYLIPAAHGNVVELLKRHGIIVEKLKADWEGQTESFLITEQNIAQRPFQGHRMIQLEGRFEAGRTTSPAGTYLARTAQPLGILLFHILEPESLDGVAAWNFLDSALAVQKSYPILKTFAQVHAPAEREP